MRKCFILLCFLCSCGGTFRIYDDTHVGYYKSPDGQFSCRAASCCYPYKEKMRVCIITDMSGIMISAKYIPEK